MIYSRFRNQKCSDPLSAGISALGNVTGGIIGAVSARQQQKREQAFNAAEAEKNRQYQTAERLAAQEFELDMWNMNNEYNSIGSQIERARAAGVNPASIVGGQYRSATSDAPTTTPMSGATASSNSAGAIGSAMIGSYSNMMNNTANAFKTLVEGKATDELLQFNKDLISSQIKYNLEGIQELASRAGLQNATRENVERATYWMDGLNEVKILETAANITRLYNENYVDLQSLKLNQDMTAQNIKESEQRILESQQDILESQQNIEESKSRERYNSTLATYQDTVNKYADDTLSAQKSQEELRAWEMQHKKDFAIALGVPLGTSEFEFNWSLYLNGAFEEFTREVLMPKEQSGWKPADYAVDSKFKLYYAYPFRPFHGHYPSTSITPAGALEDSKDYQKAYHEAQRYNRTKVHPLMRKFRDKYKY